MIKSFSFSQNEILQNIAGLYTGPIQADATFGAGCFYKKGGLPRPELCFDINPRKPGVVAADVRRLPLRPNSIRSVIFDPPFLPRTGPGSLIKDRFGSIEGGVVGLVGFYVDAIYELCRVLAPGGWLVLKCQDLVSGGKNHFIHSHVVDIAVSLGLEAIDLFLLLAARRMADPQGRPQKHARKHHSFFWVFQKRKK